MFLKRIELSGFKSFADRTELEFVPGITAVVGPNGSGKSNVSDSIRWVLGEQSAKSLRGGNMQDIIFAGSDSRHAVNYSEVSLTLDNEDNQLGMDYSEVTVTRRLHRSGESEYFINKQACRLKDITELFMDTGIGKEAYSIIGQGRIEEILSSRSEERRGIFEEASGIVKYKGRKKEAQKKLDDTDTNLIRIHDLIHELEDQLDPLREQSERAKKYKEMQEQWKKVEISLIVHRINKLHAQWLSVSEQLEALQKEQISLSTIISQQDADLELERMEARRLEEKLEAKQADLLNISREVEKNDGFGELLKERQSHLQDQMAQRNKALENRRQQTARLETEKQALLDQMETVKEQLASLEQEQQAQLSKWNEMLETLGPDEVDLKAKHMEIVQDISDHRNEIRYLDQQRTDLQQRLDKHADELSDHQEKMGRWKNQLDETRQKQSEVTRRLEQIRLDYQQLSEARKEKLNKIDEALLTVRKWQQQTDALISRRDTMKELEEGYDGFFHGVREVLKQGKAGRLSGIHGAVAELIRVPAQYETAIETALGGALQHIVMEDESASRKAIADLKQRQAGRATFLPLSVIRGRKTDANDLAGMSALAGFIGVASELIQTDSRYEHIASNLLGQVIIAETLEHANAIAGSSRYRYRVVTLDGDVVHAGGSMSGGSRGKKNSNLLGRKRAVEEMDVQIASANQKLEEFTARTTALQQEMDQLQSQLEQLREGGESERLQQQQLQNEADRYHELIAQWEKTCHEMEVERENWIQEQQNHEHAITKHEDTIHALTEQETQLARDISQLEEARSQRETARERMQQALTDLKVKAAGLEQEKQSLQQQAERIARQIAEALEEEGHIQLELETVNRDLQQSLNESVEQVNRSQQLYADKEACQISLTELRDERVRLHQQLEQEESSTKDQRQRLKRVEEQLHQTEVKVNRLDVELENALTTLAQEHELSIELARERYPEPENPEQAAQQSRDLKRQISALGEVNLGAIEEYERVHGRFLFLSEQKEDLLAAKRDLEQVIAEMEKEMSERFRHTFDAIRSRFAGVFTKLFGGGRADLVLTEPENPLETGIDIVAQPPGKKLQNLQLLSGGERALTAIGLLFAILHVKPVPFCVLDEVEAALDEANVNRFASYLREFSQTTQFIVVTHRKGTMEEADVLYGVTMEEGGVSKLVSVRLEEDMTA